MNVGIHENIAFDEYLGWKALSSSGAGHVLKSPSHYIASLEEEDDETKEKARGTAAHAAIWEPARFANLYAQGPCVDLRTKAGKAEWAEFVAANPGKVHVRGEEWPKIQGIRDAVWGHPFASQLLAMPGETELSIAWNEPGGCLCKGRVDKVGTEARIVADLKCLRDVRKPAVERVMMERGYHRAGAVYLHGLAANSIFCEVFVLICVENEKPFGIMVYEVEAEAIEAGWGDFQLAMDVYGECCKTGNWYGYNFDRESGDYQAERIGLPAWYAKREGVGV